MTLKEKNNLNIVKKSIPYDLVNITDEELYQIVVKDCLLDLIDFDTLELANVIDEITEWVEELQDKKQATIKIEALFLYIENQGYCLDTLLRTVDYNEDNFDISILSSDTLIYIEEQIQYFVSELEYTKEVEQLEEELSTLNNINLNNYTTNSYKSHHQENSEATQKQIEALKKQIQSLSKEKEQIKLTHTLQELEIVQAKEFLSTADLAILYPNFSKNRQITYRGRIHDPLPFQQLAKSCKIVYSRKEIDIWKENNNK